MVNFLPLMKDEFVMWLLAEMEKRGWNQAEFARRAEIGQATVSRVLAGENGPGDQFINGTARAFGMPPDAVMRRAGRLPDSGEVLPEARDWSARLMLLSPERREAVVLAMDNVLRLVEGEPARATRARSVRGSGDR